MNILLVLSAFFCFSIHEISGGNVKEDIRTIVENNPNQLREDEYTLIAEHLIDRSPCNMLVFGVGRDSKLWIENNPLGKTVFLEDDEIWFHRICSELPEIEAFLVKYNTQRRDWRHWLEWGNTEELLLDLPLEIQDVQWDIIFVDAPAGWSDIKPGRMKSIYTAAYLAHKCKNCHVFVHDCDRPVEASYSSTFLLDENLQQSLYRLRHYFIPSTTQPSMTRFSPLKLMPTK